MDASGGVAQVRNASVDLAAEVALESVRVRCRQSIHSGPSALLVFLLVGVLLWRETDQARLIAWLGLTTLTTVLRTAVCARILTRAVRAERGQLAIFERWLFLTTLTNTIAMGAGMWWVAAISSTEVQFFITLALCFYSVASLINSSSHPPNYSAGVIANLGQALAFWVMQGPDGVRIAVPLAVTTYLLITFSRTNARAFADAVRMKFENIALVEQLSAEKLTVEHALAVAQEANAAKARFLAAASHDLQQPLYALSLRLGALPDEINAGRGEEAIRRSRDTVQVLQHLFANLLDLSRIDAGALKPRVQVFTIEELFDGLDGEFRPQAERKDLQFIVAPAAAHVSTDLLLVERLLRNLLSNAIRYTATGTVSLTANVGPEAVHISVRDTGPGIPPTKQHLVFEEFVRLDEGGQDEAGRREGAVGLGLAIVRRINALLDLRLTLRSEPVRGSEFTVRLPLADGS